MSGYREASDDSVDLPTFAEQGAGRGFQYVERGVGGGVCDAGVC